MGRKRNLTKECAERLREEPKEELSLLRRKSLKWRRSRRFGTVFEVLRVLLAFLDRHSCRNTKLRQKRRFLALWGILDLSCWREF